MLNNTKTQSRPKLLFLVPAISKTHKSLENSQDFFLSRPRPRPRPRLYFFDLEAPGDQDFGLEDYITDNWSSSCYSQQQHSLVKLTTCDKWLLVLCQYTDNCWSLSCYSQQQRSLVKLTTRDKWLLVLCQYTDNNWSLSCYSQQQRSLVKLTTRDKCY